MKYLALFILCTISVMSCDCISSDEESKELTGEYYLVSNSNYEIQSLRCQSIFDFTSCEDIVDWNDCDFNLSGTLKIYSDGRFKRTYEISFPSFLNIEFSESQEGILTELKSIPDSNASCCYSQSDDCEDISLSIEEDLLEWEILNNNCNYTFQWQKEN